MRFATPLLKSPAWLSTFAGVSSPGRAPESGATAVIVTGFEAALKVVIVFPPTSCAVSVFVPVNAAPLACGLARANANFASEPTLIATVPDVPTFPPDVAVKVPDVAFPTYLIPSEVRFATPLLKSPAALSTEPVAPEENVAVPVSGDTAAIVTGFEAALKLVIVFPPASCAVNVLVPVNATPSVCGVASA